MPVLLLAVLCLVASIYFFWRSVSQRRKSGLPAGRVIYADTSKWTRVDKPIYDPELRLTGKPDYLVEKGKDLIPVEVKSTNVKQAPYDSHIYQLAAYCLLVHKVYDQRPPYGILHYPNRTLTVDYTKEIESATLGVLEQMRSLSQSGAVDRSHESKARCIKCSYRYICDQALQ
jgi:CRISPR-associated exonuclease Cas4